MMVSDPWEKLAETKRESLSGLIPRNGGSIKHCLSSAWTSHRLKRSLSYEGVGDDDKVYRMDRHFPRTEKNGKGMRVRERDGTRAAIFGCSLVLQNESPKYTDVGRNGQQHHPIDVESEKPPSERWREFRTRRCSTIIEGEPARLLHRYCGL